MRRHNIFILLGLSLLAFGCGGQPMREAINGSTTPPIVDNPGTGVSGFTGFTGATGPTGPLLPPITTAFTITGQGGTTPLYETTVTTDNLLRVKITPGQAGQISVPGYSNFSGTYNCISYRVKILGQTVDTGVMQINGGSYSCASAPTSVTLDLSNRLTPGHGAITIGVETSGYDFYCQNCYNMPWLYGAYPYGPYSCSLYCPSHTVYRTHTVNGTMAIQVNGTSL